MSGSYSRSKGRRSEYIVRDALRELGYKCDRVERSGAGLEKGDLRLEIPETRFGEHPLAAKFLYAEVKCRKNEFAPIYVWLDQYTQGNPQSSAAYILRLDETAFIAISYSFNGLSLLDDGKASSLWLATQLKEEKLNKIFLRLEKFVKGCDFLAIRIDRKPPIYLRYL